jgi:hypothetical protein
MLENRVEVFSVGERYGDQEEMFGRIEEAVLDSFNRVYILDSRMQNIRVFNLDGEYITKLGGKGKGPGEFERARSMTNYYDKLLLVNNGYRIEVYNIENEEIEFVETLQLEKRSHSLCAIEDKLFIHILSFWIKRKKWKRGITLIRYMHIPCHPLSHFFRLVNPIKVRIRW